MHMDNTWTQCPRKFNPNLMRNYIYIIIYIIYIYQVFDGETCKVIEPRELSVFLSNKICLNNKHSRTQHWLATRWFQLISDADLLVGWTLCGPSRWYVVAAGPAHRRPISGPRWHTSVGIYVWGTVRASKRCRAAPGNPEPWTTLQKPLGVCLARKF